MQAQRMLLWFTSKSVLPLFSSKGFIVSGLTFRSLVHFEFILLHVVVQFSEHQLLKRLVFSPLYILAFFVKDTVPIGVWAYLWTFYLVPLVYILSIALITLFFLLGKYFSRFIYSLSTCMFWWLWNILSWGSDMVCSAAPLLLDIINGTGLPWWFWQ